MGLLFRKAAERVHIYQFISSGASEQGSSQDLRAFTQHLWKSGKGYRYTHIRWPAIHWSEFFLTPIFWLTIIWPTIWGKAPRQYYLRLCTDNEQKLVQVSSGFQKASIVALLSYRLVGTRQFLSGLLAVKFFEALAVLNVQCQQL